MNSTSRQSSESGVLIECPACKSTVLDAYCRASDLNWCLPGEFQYLKCKTCLLVFQWPQPELSKIGALYPLFYGSSSSFSGENIERHVESEVNRIRADIISRVCSAGSIFDVGCGSGFFLEYMRRRGYTVGGLDPAPEHVAFARKEFEMENLLQGSWPQTGYTEKTWDVCSFIHVIEHLPRPVKMLMHVRDVLKPGGFLVLETPNVRSWPARLFGNNWVTLDAPRHLNLFSPGTLMECVQHAGFKAIFTMTYSPSTMEYSESLRYLMQAKGWRSPKMIGKEEENIETASPKGKGIASICSDSFHRIESLVYRGVNYLADAVDSGCNILLIASMNGGSDDSGE